MAVLEAITPVHSISEVVYDKLKAAVVSDAFKEGERLVEAEIAAKLKVSRTPVRTALQRLESEGMLESRGGQGFFVKEYTPDDIREIYLIREALESLAAERAARAATDRDIQAIRGIVREMEEACANPDVMQSEIFDLHKRFSDAYNRASHMPTLVRMIESIKDRMTHFRRVSLSGAERREAALREHRAMLEAVERRDPAQAADLAKAHIMGAYDAYLRSSNDRDLQPI